MAGPVPAPQITTAGYQLPGSVSYVWDSVNSVMVTCTLPLKIGDAVALSGNLPDTGPGDLAAIRAAVGGTLKTADANGAAYQGVVAITPGTATPALRSLGYICTTAGNVTLTLADGSTITLGLAVATTFQTLPFAVTNVALGTGTAGTFWNLK